MVETRAAGGKPGDAAQAPPGLLLIAHGTRDPAGGEEMATLLRQIGQRYRGPIEHAWLEDFAAPAVSEAVTDLVDAGAETIVSVPFLNFGAGHAKTDVPGALATARSAHPQVAFVHGRVLGLHPALFTLARQRVADARAATWPDAPPPDAPGAAGAEEVLVVAASGSSDPDANADVAKAARFLAEGSGHRWAEIAFAGVTWPHPAEVLRRAAAAGARRAVLFSWSLLAGLLEQRVAEAAREVAAATELAVAEAGRFGPDPLVAEAVLDRAQEAMEGDARMNCDLCAYRVPLPGLEDRLGAPSGGGTGRRAPAR